MFIVFNKQKIYSYLVALSTVVILFVIAFAVTNQEDSTLQTSTNAENSNIVTNQVNNINLNQTGKNVMQTTANGQL